MAVRRPLLAPRQLLILFAGITVGLTIALVWLGIMLAYQDRALVRERMRERLEHTAGLVVAALQTLVSRTEADLSRVSAFGVAERADTLAAWGRSLPAGAVYVDEGADGPRAFPVGRLLFLPERRVPEEATSAALEHAERLEFQQRDLSAAGDVYRKLAASPDRRLRAAALLRLGRVLAKNRRAEEALLAYQELSGIDSIPVAGVPAGLVGRHARLTTLEASRRRSEAAVLVDSLSSGLQTARWRLTRGGYEYYASEVARASGHVAAASTTATSIDIDDRQALSLALDSLWRERASNRNDEAGPRVLLIDGGAVLAVSSAAPDRTILLLLSRRHVEEAWLSYLGPLLQRERAWIALRDQRGTRILSAIPDTVKPLLVQPAAETGLPWTLMVASRDPFTLTADLAARRRLLLAGLVVTCLLGTAGIWAVVRGLGRELDVARLQSEFVTAVSHEFRTPLTSLRQLTELLASGRVLSEERRRRYFDVLQKETTRLHRLVEGLLDFGRMEGGAREFHFEAIDAALLATSVVSEFRQDSASEGCSIECVTPVTACVVNGDREALTRALWNLLDNAAKYSPSEKFVTVAVTRLDGHVTISVKDQGQGIPLEEQGAVFDKFVRGTTARAAGVQGTGLGLAMVRRIVVAHGGHVRVESEPGRGSTFALDLPAVTTI